MKIEVTKLENLKNYKKIAIVGGTFDPIHYGHLVTGEAVYHKFNMDKIIFIPTGDPAHKDGVTKSNHRFEMTCMAIENNDKFEISTIEIDRQGKTYTVDTIEEFKKYCVDDVEIYFVMGADSIYNLHKWKNFEKLINMCKFIGVTRPNYDKSNMEKLVKKLNIQYNAQIYFMEIPALDISSSDLRKRINDGMSVRYLLPDNVADYIEKFDLYKNEVEN